MRLVLAAMSLAVLVSCASDAERLAEQRQDEVRTAFGAWRDAVAAGDSRVTFERLSAAFQSAWLFNLLDTDDAIATTARGNLKGTPRTDLDLWLEVNRKDRQQRALVLPSSVLGTPWLAKVWDDCFLPDKAFQEQMGRVEVLQPYVDSTGATVICRDARGQRVLYGMVVENGMWKVDSYRPSLSQSR